MKATKKHRKQFHKFLKALVLCHKEHVMEHGPVPFRTGEQILAAMHRTNDSYEEAKRLAEIKHGLRRDPAIAMPPPAPLFAVRVGAPIDPPAATTGDPGLPECAAPGWEGPLLKCLRETRPQLEAERLQIARVLAEQKRAAARRQREFYDSPGNPTMQPPHEAAHHGSCAPAGPASGSPPQSPDLSHIAPLPAACALSGPSAPAPEPIPSVASPLPTSRNYACPHCGKSLGPFKEIPFHDMWADMQSAVPQA